MRLGVDPDEAAYRRNHDEDAHVLTTGGRPLPAPSL